MIEGIQTAVRDLLVALGQDPECEGLKDTPRRVAKAYDELLGGYVMDVPALLATQFSAEYDEIVALTGIDFVSLCEHHLLPFVGEACVAYIPKDGKVVGLSKLARVVDAYARRLQLQERMTVQIADALEKYLEPTAVAVLVRAQHGCMQCRGVRKSHTVMHTSVMRGAFREKSSARAEVLAIFQGPCALR